MRRAGPFLALTMLLAQTTLAAQATGPQSNLVFGVAGTFTTGHDMWSVPDQPVFATTATADTLAVSRTMESGLGLMFYGMYFPHKTFGFSGEVFFMGTNYEDGCNHVFALPVAPGETPIVANACRDIASTSRSTSTVMITTAALLRFFPRGRVSPYLRLGVGAAIINRSSIAMSGQTGSGVLEVYVDENTRSFSPALVAGFGITAQSKGGGYQVRLEVRDNIIGYDVVTQATPRSGIQPPTNVDVQHLFTFMIGFDIVLEKNRGRRY